MIMKEICLDKVDTFKKVQKPEYRLAMILTTTALGVSTQNQIKKLQDKTTVGVSLGSQISKAPEAKRTEIQSAKAQKMPVPSSAPEDEKKDEVKTQVKHKMLIPEDEKVKFLDL